MLDIKEVGLVEDVKKAIVTISGLSNCMNGQLVDFEGGSKGIVMSFNENRSSVLVFADKENIEPKDTVISRAQNLTIPVGESYLGRVINPLGEPIDRKGIIESDERYPLFRDAAGVLDRMPLDEAVETGVKVIDAVIPIGKGQRELIVGDRVTGKTTLTTDIILNQKDKDVVCIYCCIGKSFLELLKVTRLLEQKEAFKYTIVVSAVASASAGEQYLAPYAAATLGEYFMHKGQHVLVVFDDLTKHAWVYREISLLLERSPGRDAYPGDIFYLHSQLMERAGKLNSRLGGGSMTFFPIAETLEGDVTGYIPSNLISMTDGQIYLNASLFSEGFKPAVDLKLSVSRIGNKVQCPAMRDLSERLRLEYVQYSELIRMTKIKTGISEAVENKIKRGEALTEIFMQNRNNPVSTERQIILLYALRNGLLDDLSRPALNRFKREIFNFVSQYDAHLIEEIKQQKELSSSLRSKLDKALEGFFERQKI